MTFLVRIKILGGFAAALLLMLVARLWVLQLTQWPGYARQAVGNKTAIVRHSAPRGLIFDREGRVLAENRPVYSVCVVGSDLPPKSADLEKMLPRLAGYMGVSTAALRTAITECKKRNVLEAVPLPKIGDDVPFSAMAQIEEHRLELPGIVIHDNFARYYPCGTLAGHALGYARPVTALQYEKVKDLDYPQPEQDAADPRPRLPDPVYARDSVYGQQGVEALCELDRSSDPPLPMLQGYRGRDEYEVDATGRELRVVESRSAAQGASVYLSLDARLQKVAEDALASAAGDSRTAAAVMLDVHTGEVLVLASYPSIDPNKWVHGFSSEEWASLNNDPRRPMMNKAVAGGYPPGSIFKMISSCAALETTRATTATSFTCTGAIHEGRAHQRFGCWKPQGHGTVDFLGGLAESCDVFFYELCLEDGLTSDAIADYARRFGLGESTKLGLAGEIDGVVPDQRWKLDARHEPWRLGDTLHMVIGQGDVVVSPLQMAVVTAAVANGGTLVHPHLVKKVAWPQSWGVQPTLTDAAPARKVAVKAETLEIVRRAMRQAVIGRGGTAAALARLGIPAAGKTGSAETVPGKPPHAWFCCFAPYDDPQYAVTVFVSEGGHGGTVAAPVAGKILAAAFNLNEGAFAQEAVNSD